MQIPRQLAFLAEGWLPVFLVLLATFFVAQAACALLKKFRTSPKFQKIAHFDSTIYSILTVLGLKIAAELAPLHPKIEASIQGGLYIAVVGIFSCFIRQLFLTGLEWSSLRTNTSDTLRRGFIPLLRNLVTLFALASGCIIILKHFGYDVMSLVAALGVSSLAVGLASKDTLSHMISGFILIIDRNLRPGDRINLGGTVGDLKEIGLRSTQIQLPDGTTMIVPNSELVNTRVLNLTLQSRNLLCTTQIRIPVSTPFKTVRSICLGILNQMDRAIIRGVKEKPTWVNLHSLAEGYQNIHIGFWVSELNSAASILSDFHEQLLVTLIEKQISFISYPCCPQFTLTRELK